MSEAGIQHVVLYRTPKGWRVSVTEIPGAIGCGVLPDTPQDAPIEIAQDDLLQYLRQYWNFEGTLTWQQTEPNWWAAEPGPPAGQSEIV
ncbi:hypothetical protein [Planosporangium mesophilum]|uniref:Uncharacterized protein n=1 Tax=Planosporangium mesophilum TaxID=689768 RepID=A0A8J3TDW1_9ACTN|nr:hypothetical protein [Planosporangium mesophilum]NJC85493.1 hypothetical protein [Planosporangium mesophilum]GII24643.1 hypothetical protein Pme01_42400 [Planosporangium mesophilum]